MQNKKKSLPQVFKKIHNLLVEYFGELSKEKETELRTMQDTILDLSDKKSKLQNKIDQFEEDYKEKKEYLDNLDTQIEDAEADIMEKSSELEELSHTLPLERRELVVVTKDLKEKKAELQKKTQLVTNAQETTDNLKEEKKTLEESIEKLVEDKEEAQRVFDVTAEELLGQIQTIRYENKTLKKAVSKASESLKTINDDAKVKRTELEELQKSLDISKTALENIDKELAQRRQEVEDGFEEERKEIAKGHTEVKELKESLHTKSEAVLVQEKTVAERNMMLNKHKATVIKIVSDIASGKKGNLEGVINQLKKL